MLGDFAFFNKEAYLIEKGLLRSFTLPDHFPMRVGPWIPRWQADMLGETTIEVLLTDMMRDSQDVVIVDTQRRVWIVERKTKRLRRLQIQLGDKTLYSLRCFEESRKRVLDVLLRCSRSESLLSSH